ncbi:MAG TPA: maleylpyruvate isomerase N-terminal domain-containing protein [Actinomycetota bacterium]|nr:maleylpyruvate isomerase N-terminal domain-containing protein [Actinomycetota bacterium]
MDAAAIEAAYQPFVAALRSGGFGPPTEGWSAEEVAAHVALNNDLISAAAEALMAGEPLNYDNIEVVDEAVLDSYVAEVGGLDGLADAVAASAARLASAAAALDEAGEAYPLPVLIIHEGRFVREGPEPLGGFIEGNVTFHLQMHLAQLLALRE